MEFDKSRVFSAVNADELPIGSKCIFADTVKALRKKVQADDYTQYVQSFIRLHDNSGDVQFLADCYLYNYAYLVEPPAGAKYRPFESVESAMDAIKKHGGWVKKRSSGVPYILVEKEGNICLLEIGNQDRRSTSNDLFKDFVFADDGSPCGGLVEG